MHLLDEFNYAELDRRLELSAGKVEQRFATAIYHMPCQLDGGDERAGVQPE